MPRRSFRLLIIFAVALAAILTPLASTYAVAECCEDCDEQRAYQGEYCSDCVVCVTGLCCLVPTDAVALGGSLCVIGRVDSPDRTGQLRNDPPPLRPPRPFGRYQPFP